MMKHIKIFEQFVSELTIPSGKWVELDLMQIDDKGMQTIWDMYTSTYAQEGLDFSADDYHELRTKYKATAIKDIDSDQIPDAFIIYKKTRWGNKLALLGTNGKKKAKKEVVKKLLELVNTKGWFLEAGMKIEEIMKANNAPVIMNQEMIIDVVGAKKKPEFEEDGYYTRLLSKVGKRIRKRMYGKI